MLKVFTAVCSSQIHSRHGVGTQDVSVKIDVILALTQLVSWGMHFLSQ